MEKAALDHIVEASDARGADATPPGVVTTLVERAIGRSRGGDGFSRVVEELRGASGAAR